MGGFSGDHYRALRLLGSYPNGCSERLIVWNGVAVDTMVDLIHAGPARAETIRPLVRGRPMEVARMKITEAGRRARFEGLKCPTSFRHRKGPETQAPLAVP
jgi:hypothetical protein